VTTDSTARMSVIPAPCKSAGKYRWSSSMVPPVMTCWRPRQTCARGTLPAISVDVEIEALFLDRQIHAVCADRVDRLVELLLQIVISLAYGDAVAFAEQRLLFRGRAANR